MESLPQLNMIERHFQLQLMSAYMRQGLEWKGFKSLLFEQMKGFSLQKLALQFFKSEAKCVTFPNIKTFHVDSNSGTVI